MITTILRKVSFIINQNLFNFFSLIGINKIKVEFLRKLIKFSNLKPYELLHGETSRNIGERIFNIYKNGWKPDSSYPSINLLSNNIPWEESLKENRSWCYKINSWDFMEDFLIDFSQNKNQKSLFLCVNLALDWINKYSNNFRKFEFAWYDMAVGKRAYKLAFILDSASRFKSFSNTEILQLYTSLLRHKNFLSVKENISFHSNHGFFQLSGLILLTNRFMFIDEMKQINKKTINEIISLIYKQFSKEGIHLEHSPDYHRLVYLALKRITDAGITFNVEILKFLNKIDYNLHWFIKPDGNLTNFGDSNLRQMIRPEADPNIWFSDEMKYIASKGNTGKLSEDRVIAFEKSGYFIAKNNWPNFNTKKTKTYLSQIACFHSRTHKHADDLSFIWTDNNINILIDSGKYGYSGKTKVDSDFWNQGFYYDDPKRMYVESTRAHNTIEIDGKDFQRKGRTPYGSAIKKSGIFKEIIFCETEVIHFSSINHSRLLLLYPSKWLIVLDWLLETRNLKHSYKQWFHFSPELNPIITPRNYLIEVPNKSENLLVTPLIDNSSMSKIYFGETKPFLQGWFSPKNYTLEPNPTISFEQLQTINGLFATLFIFTKNTEIISNSMIDINQRIGNINWKDGYDWYNLEFNFTNGKVFINFY